MKRSKNFSKKIKNRVIIISVCFLALVAIFLGINKLSNIESVTFDSKKDIAERMKQESEVFNSIMSSSSESENPLYDTGATVTGEYGTYDNINYKEEDHIKYVETVRYGKDGAQEIVITPETDYTVTKITINGENYAFIPDETGKVTIPVFENVTEDKHVIVEVDKNISSILVNHYLWTEEDGITENKVADSEYYADKVGEKYTTAPKMDIEYVIITNEDYYSGKTESEILAILEANNWEELGYESFDEFKADYYIPTNATGEYTAEQQVINYYYKAKTYTLTVEHLIEGTEDRVPNKTNGEPVEDEHTEGYKYGDEYTTLPSNDIDYSVYELVSSTDNTEGEITEDTIVKYYYRIKDGADIVVHHYIVGTETRVPSNIVGEVVEDEIYNTVIDEVTGEERQAKVGDPYTTENAEDRIYVTYKVATNKDVYGDEIPAGLNAEDEYVPSNHEGTYKDETQEVIYYYVLKNI